MNSEARMFLARQMAYRVNSKLFGNTLAPLRSYIWRLVGVKIGVNCNIYHDVNFITGKISVGDGVYIGPETLITGGEIVIGDHVDISARVLMHAGTHEIGSISRRAGKALLGKIVVENGSWIGASSTLISGAVVRCGVIVGAGSVVTGELRENCVAFGVPAKAYRDLC